MMSNMFPKYINNWLTKHDESNHCTIDGDSCCKEFYSSIRSPPFLFINCEYVAYEESVETLIQDLNNVVDYLFKWSDED